MSNYYKDVTEYFNGKADEYDDVDEQLYWVLSDRFYKEVLKRELKDFVSSQNELRILDAGAGTGRWTLFFHELFNNENRKVSGTLIDISADMLAVAKKKISEKKLDDVYNSVIGNIEDMKEVADDHYDLSLSFYNVLSFVENPTNAVREIGNKLKLGGMHISVVGNTYHALYFSVLTGRTKEIDRITNESKIAFNDLMPPMHCFTPNEIKELYLQNGFSKVEVKGGPNFMYPGMEETFVKGQTETIVSKLADDSALQKILDTELSMYDADDIVGRGNTLIVFATK
jgi:ubiquinone/menaquinone biosynthesis C-methylase UbiE